MSAPAFACPLRAVPRPGPPAPEATRARPPSRPPAGSSRRANPASRRSTD